jgi:hypothetical protein
VIENITAFKALASKKNDTGGYGFKKERYSLNINMKWGVFVPKK